ncbi:MAG: hypothetical protein HZR80_18875 [Candidatus Heimdallarchaeota archaeon]
MRKKMNLIGFSIFFLVILIPTVSIVIAPIVLDPGGGGGGGGGTTYPTLKRTWIYNYDDGYISTGDGTRVNYVIKEYLLPDGGWRITYTAKIDYFYDLTFSKEFQVHIFNPYGNVWYRLWITTDDATTVPVGNGRYHIYAYKTESFDYPSNYDDSFVGIRGGIIDLNQGGYICLYYGCILKFRIDNSNYGSIQKYSDWHDDGECTYGFFGPYDNWATSYGYPNYAWYNVMDDMAIYI